MFPLLIIALAFAVFVIVFSIKGFMIIQHQETMIVERLGEYNRMLAAGVNFILPLLDKPRPIKWKYETFDETTGEKKYYIRETNRIDLRENVFDFPPQNVITNDNVSIRIDALLYFQITDPVKAVYEISNLPDAIEKLAQTSLRNIIGEMNLDDTLVSRDEINEGLRRKLDEATDKWGVKITRVELEDIMPPEDIQDAMEKEMRAEREKRAAILTAEGEKQSAILKAEGLRQSEVYKAEGHKHSLIMEAEGQAEAISKKAAAEAEAIKLVADTIGLKDDPNKYVMAFQYMETLRYVETMKEMVSGKENKVVYMPYETSGVLSSVGSVFDLLTKKQNKS